MDVERDAMRFHIPLRRSIWIGVVMCLVVAAATIAWRMFVPSPIRIHSYQESFAMGNADEWTAFGGTWELANGTMRNDSDERGAKLLTGSGRWRNYSVEADITLLGQGDAGLLIRSSKEEEGVDAYSGYYSGIRTIDNSLVLGRAQHGWREITQKVFQPQGIQPFQRYHLKLLAYDCEIVSALTSAAHPVPESIRITDPFCAQA